MGSGPGRCGRDGAEPRSGAGEDQFVPKVPLPLALAVLFSGSWCAPALAHGSERGFVLLLPTRHYLFGGAAAVAATFLLLVLLSGRWVDRIAEARLRLGSVPPISRAPTSLASFLLLLLLLAAGLYTLFGLWLLSTPVAG